MHSSRTHVASTVCSVPFGTGACSAANGGCGVVNSCKLCSVKHAKSDGSWWASPFLAGLDHIVAQCAAARTAANDPDLGCVVNFSGVGPLYDPPSQDAKAAAVRDAVAAGVVFVAAAGNNGADACAKSPGIEPMAITVGATSSDDAVRRRLHVLASYNVQFGVWPVV